MTIVEAQAPVLSDPRADLTMLTGTWRNTNAESAGIVKIVPVRLYAIGNVEPFTTVALKARVGG